MRRRVSREQLLDASQSILSPRRKPMSMWCSLCVLYVAIRVVVAGRARSVRVRTSCVVRRSVREG